MSMLAVMGILLGFFLMVIGFCAEMPAVKNEDGSEVKEKSRKRLFRKKSIGMPKMKRRAA